VIVFNENRPDRGPRWGAFAVMREPTLQGPAKLPNVGSLADCQVLVVHLELVSLVSVPFLPHLHVLFVLYVLGRLFYSHTAG